MPKTKRDGAVDCLSFACYGRRCRLITGNDRNSISGTCRFAAVRGDMACYDLTTLSSHNIDLLHLAFVSNVATQCDPPSVY